ncbi:DNA gyrase inhibitor YacG [Catenovulum sediminis]|uniref:DNA gyrase inhibitor YacG n=1 Tax=Catenovulum sediminis TaxID=1740262 RepID=UPI0011813C6D|nr:DNA gyrase inhibitor YacG [Catenovulum sediminis]
MLKVQCPTCDTQVEWKEANKFKPFCSHRCKLIDLGEWASESNVIAGPSANELDPRMDEFDIEASFQPSDDFFR